MTLIDQLHRCEEALRDRLALGIDTTKGKRLENKLAKRFSAYFASLSRTFPYEKLPAFLAQASYMKLPPGTVITQEDALGDKLLKAAEDMIAAMLAKHAHELADLMADATLSGFTLGAEQAYHALGLEYDVAQLNARATAISKTSAAAKVVQIDQVTLEGLRSLIAEGSLQGWSVPQLAKQIRDNFGAMADAYKGRARTIAQTELANSASAASLETYKEYGVPAKSWMLGGEDPCDICLANAAEGIIPVGQAFSSGDDAPTAHPRCLCALVPEVGEK